MSKLSLYELIKAKKYPGRGIVIGKTDAGKKAVVAYFIMGRSENSRNRVFKEEGEGIKTEAYDESKLTDPSLIIYSPVKIIDNKLIVSNGDQTDTIYEGLKSGLGLESSLKKRSFEPDAPNYTPRISGLMEFNNKSFSYALSILKSNEGDPDSCQRFIFNYDEPLNEEGHFIHTYEESSEVLESFKGVPLRVSLEDEIEEFTKKLWKSLDADNKVSLFVRYIDLETGKSETKIINKNK